MYICACLKSPGPAPWVHGGVPDRLLKRKAAGEFEKKKFSVGGFLSEGLDMAKQVVGDVQNQFLEDGDDNMDLYREKEMAVAFENPLNDACNDEPAARSGGLLASWPTRIQVYDDPSFAFEREE